MQWRDDDVVEVFGRHPDAGQFLAMVRDAQSGIFMRMVAPGEDEENKEFKRLYNLAWGNDRQPPRQACAILDTGILYAHPLIKNRILGEIDFTDEGLDDSNGHGTWMALIGIRGLPQSSGLLNVKIAGSTGRGSPTNLIRGLEWVVDYKQSHSDHQVFINLSVGVYRRRLLGLLPCDGTCDVCNAAVRAASAGIFISVAAGNTAGKTPCPATVALKRPDLGISVVTLVDVEDVGMGTIGVTAASLARPVPMAEDATESHVLGLSGTAAYQHMLKLGEEFQDQGDLQQAEKTYRHLAEHSDDPQWSSRGSVALGLLLASQSRYIEAEQCLLVGANTQEADEHTHAQALYALGFINNAMGHEDSTERWLRETVATDHPHFAPQAAALLAKVFLGAGKFEAAGPLLEKAMHGDDHEDRLSAQYNRAILARRQGNRRAALEELRSVAQVPSRVRHAAALSVASILAEEGSNQEALRWLKLASEAPDPQTAAKAELALGDFAAAVSYNEGARIYYERAVKRGVDGISSLAQAKIHSLC
jgi:tetratricopeptide (TPR) repeat protein